MSNVYDSYKLEVGVSRINLHSFLLQNIEFLDVAEGGRYMFACDSPWRTTDLIEPVGWSGRWLTAGGCSTS